MWKLFELKYFEIHVRIEYCDEINKNNCKRKILRKKIKKSSGKTFSHFHKVNLKIHLRSLQWHHGVGSDQTEGFVLQSPEHKIQIQKSTLLHLHLTGMFRLKKQQTIRKLQSLLLKWSTFTIRKKTRQSVTSWDK